MNTDRPEVNDSLTTQGEYEQWMVPAWCLHEQPLHVYFTILHHSSIAARFLNLFKNQLAMIDDLRRLMVSYEHWWHYYATLHCDSTVIMCKMWSATGHKLVVGLV